MSTFGLIEYNERARKCARFTTILWRRERRLDQQFLEGDCARSGDAEEDLGSLKAIMGRARWTR